MFFGGSLLNFSLQETPPPKDMRFLAGIRTCVKVWESPVWESKKMLRRAAAQEKNEYLPTKRLHDNVKRYW